MKSSLKHRAGWSVLPIALLLVTGCAERAIPVQSFPASVDLQSVTEPKPRPSPVIVTDPQANARYDAAIEGWGEGLLASGRRICEWAKGMGYKLPFECRREPGKVVP